MQVSRTLLGSRLIDQSNMSLANNPCPSILLHSRGQCVTTHPTLPYPLVIPETFHMRTFMVDSPYNPTFAHPGESGPMVGVLLDEQLGSHQSRTEPVLPIICHERTRDHGSRNLQQGLSGVTSQNTPRSEHTLDQGETSIISSAVLDLVLNGSFDVLPRHSSSGIAGRWLPSHEDEWPVAVRPLRTEGGTTRGALAAIPIPHGTELGPLLPLRPILSTDTEFSTFNQFLWEVYDTEGGGVHYVQALGWMAHVGVAPNDSLQNLEVVQRGTDIYYKALRNIGQGETLLVWYSSSQSSFFGINLPSERSTTLLPNETCLRHKDENKPQMSTFGVISDVKGGHLRCTVCKRGFNSRSNLRSHMRTHTLHRPFKCNFCDRGFSQSSTLRNHIRLHTGEKPYKCLVCQSSYSQLAGLRAHQKSARHRPKLPAISDASAVS